MKKILFLSWVVLFVLQTSAFAGKRKFVLHQTSGVKTFDDRGRPVSHYDRQFLSDRTVGSDPIVGGPGEEGSPEFELIKKLVGTGTWIHTSTIDKIHSSQMDDFKAKGLYGRPGAGHLLLQSYYECEIDDNELPDECKTTQGKLEVADRRAAAERQAELNRIAQQEREIEDNRKAEIDARVVAAQQEAQVIEMKHRQMIEAQKSATENEVRVLKQRADSLRREYVPLCFPGPVPVCVQDWGRYRQYTYPIDQFQVGDDIVNCDLNSEGKDCVCSKVEEAVIRQIDHLVVLTILGKTLVTTDQHPFLVKDRGWVEAQDLQVQDLLLTLSGESFELEAKDRQVVKAGQKFKAYQLKIKGGRTYSGLKGLLVYRCGKGQTAYPGSRQRPLPPKWNSTDQKAGS